MILVQGYRTGHYEPLDSGDVMARLYDALRAADFSVSGSNLHIEATDDKGGITIVLTALERD
jgi:hypothetical protein